MATGPEHYREAEDWMTVADNAVGKSSEHVIMAAAMAQAHATLALAAATALASTGVGEADLGEWTATICPPEGTDDLCPCGCFGGPDDCTCGDGSCRCSDCPTCDPIPHARAAEQAEATEATR